MRFLVQRDYGSSGSVSNGRTQGLRVVKTDVLLIGRSAAADLRFSDASVDVEHARLEYVEGRYRLTDLESLTGTYVGGVGISATWVRSGDEIEVGDNLIRLSQGAPEEPLMLRVTTPEGTGRPSAVVGASARAAQDKTGSFARTGQLKRRDLSATMQAIPRPLGAGRETEGDELTVPLDELTETTPVDPPTQPDLREAMAESVLEEEQVVKKAEPPTTPYVGAYTLGRGLLSLSNLTLVASVAAFGVVGYLFARQEREWVQPGPLSSAHQLISGADSCGECHEPWQGASSALCEECHPGPIHDPRQEFTPECVTCHLEHRSASFLARLDDSRCVDCHQELVVAGFEPPIFAKAIDSFEAHPDFSVDVGSGSTQRRLTLDRAVADKADGTRLAFNHRLHLNLDEQPGGPHRQLECASCHVQSADDQLMSIVDYEAQCESCHKLNYDPDRPPAPHLPPERVYEHIVETYASARGQTNPSQETQRRLAIFRRNVKVLSVDERVERRAFSAATRLYENQCDKCHQLEWGEEGGNESWPPLIRPVAIPENWLPHALFNHERHQFVECRSCHEAAWESTETADVLLQGIETCRECHRGSGATTGRATASGARTGSADASCVSCHLYHERSESGSWASVPSVASPQPSATPSPTTDE